MSEVIAGSTLAFAQNGRTAAAALAAGPEHWEHELHRLAGLGFAAVDFVDSWFPVDGLDEAALAQLAAAISAAGLRLAGVSIVRCSVIDPEHGATNLDRVLRGAEVAATLGAPVLSIGFHRPLTPAQRHGLFWMQPAPQDDRSEATWSLAAERVRIVTDRCRELGLALSLELHEGTLLAESSGALRILDAVGRDNVGVNPDVGNLVRVPYPLLEDPLATIERCGPHMNYWHLKNYVRLEHDHGGATTAPCALGDGAINYRLAVEIARRNGFAGPYCIEHYGGDPLWAMQQSRLYLTSVLEEAQ